MLRTLFALANGSQIVMEEWIYDCLDKGRLVAPVDFVYLRAKVPKPFEGKNVLLCYNDSTTNSPGHLFWQKLMNLVGAQRLESSVVEVEGDGVEFNGQSSVDAEKIDKADYFFFETVEDLRKWFRFKSKEIKVFLVEKIEKGSMLIFPKVC